MVLAGTIAYENMGLKPLVLLWTSDIWSQIDIYWGSETEWLAQVNNYADLEDPSTMEKPFLFTWD
jgi:catalase (peroxidase I)